MSLPCHETSALTGMTDNRNDEELMLAYASGDMAAFEALYARHRGPLYRFIARGLSPRASADECFQETWARVVQARERYRPEAKFSTWLYQIAQRLMIDQYRRARPQVSLDDEDARIPLAQEEQVQPDHSVSRFEQARRLQQALAELPDEQRIVLQLRLEQELSLEAIGEVTGVGRETVKSRLRYAMDKLRARLQP
ncbi:MAG TPA: RNA polymerase sigma factor [Chiayiivirga sp.]|nr:RNA polymerase sigma factor [Chiayiivirga sp.]